MLKMTHHFFRKQQLQKLACFSQYRNTNGERTSIRNSEMVTYCRTLIRVGPIWAQSSCVKSKTFKCFRFFKEIHMQIPSKYLAQWICILSAKCEGYPNSVYKTFRKFWRSIRLSAFHPYIYIVSAYAELSHYSKTSSV